MFYQSNLTIKIWNKKKNVFFRTITAHIFKTHFIAYRFINVVSCHHLLRSCYVQFPPQEEQSSSRNSRFWKWYLQLKFKNIFSDIILYERERKRERERERERQIQTYYPVIFWYFRTYTKVQPTLAIELKAFHAKL